MNCHIFSAMKNALLFLLAAFVVLFHGPQVKAADSTTTSPDISWSGFVDVYYSRNFNNPSNRMNQLRNFDVYENQLGLNLAQLSLREQPQPVGFHLDLGFGTANDIVQGLLNPLTGQTSPMTSTLDLVEQAYLSAIIPIGSGLTVNVGKFATLMGYEDIETNRNWNYSRSLLFSWAVPYYHTGIRLIYPFSSRLTTSLYVVNGWNNVVEQNNSKTVGLGIDYSLSSATAITLNGMTGFEQPAGVPYGKTDVGELIVTQRAGNDLSFAADAVYGRERVEGVLDIWKGIALYARYNLNRESDIALRGEVYYDPQGFTTGVTFRKATFKEITATYEYRPWSHLILMLEGRKDFANGDAFISSGSLLPAKSLQPTLLLGAVAAF